MAVCNQKEIKQEVSKRGSVCVLYSISKNELFKVLIFCEYKGIISSTVLQANQIICVYLFVYFLH